MSQPVTKFEHLDLEQRQARALQLQAEAKEAGELATSAVRIVAAALADPVMVRVRGSHYEAAVSDHLRPVPSGPEALLPKPISGEVRVKATEKSIGRAV